MDRKLTVVTVVGLLAVSAAGIGVAGALDGAQAAGNDDATVTVSATGQVSAEPDRAVVRVAATASADDASTATDRLAANVSELRAALDDENLSVESVRTTGYSVDRERTEDGPGGYLARQSFAVTTTAVDDSGAIIDAAVDSGASEVGGVSFELSDERRRDLRADAIDAAVVDAESQAEAVAASTGLELGAVRSVETGDSGVGPVEVVAAEDQATTIDASPVTVSATVEVTYNATGG